MQSAWKAVLDPVITLPQNSARILQNVALINGTNTIAHGLNRKLQGWSLTRKRAAAEIYDEQDDNPNPETTLILISDAAVTVNLEVF